MIVRHSNFTLCYSEKFEQPKWVAYRLTAAMFGGSPVSRTNNFREDPDVRSGSALPSDYAHSGFDRGHLCPAADMSFSESAMSETFYMSNMSPQIPAFNRGIWKHLEEKVRSWAKVNDELFVVTAGVLTDSLRYIGANKVAVPEYFYKVILDHTSPEFKAIAFILPNEGSKQDLMSFAVSIDSVEALTGLDFFPGLPDEEEVLLESRFETDAWR